MEQKDTWYFQIFNWKGKGHCPSIRKRGRIERLGRLRSEKGQEGPNSTFENCLQFVSSSPSLQSTRPSHLLGTISHCQKYQTLCVAFEKNWHRKRFLACINKFKRKGIANRIVANSCYGLKVVKIIVQHERSHKNVFVFLNMIFIVTNYCLLLINPCLICERHSPESHRNWSAWKTRDC